MDSKTASNTPDRQQVIAHRTASVHVRRTRQKVMADMTRSVFTCTRFTHPRQPLLRFLQEGREALAPNRLGSVPLARSASVDSDLRCRLPRTLNRQSTRICDSDLHRPPTRICPAGLPAPVSSQGGTPCLTGGDARSSEVEPEPPPSNQRTDDDPSPHGWDAVWPYFAAHPLPGRSVALLCTPTPGGGGPRGAAVTAPSASLPGQTRRRRWRRRQQR
jgi:hypothetical protein